MERRPHSTNGDFMSRRIHEEPTEELRTSKKCNRRVTEEHEIAIWQEKKEPSRTASWQTCVVGEQEHSIESTLEEVEQ